MKQLLLIVAAALLPFASDAQNITTIAGGGDVSGENVPALRGHIKPQSIAVDAAGNLYIASPDYNAIKKVSASTGLMQTIAGTYSAGYSGDGGPATAAQLHYPTKIIVDPSGNIYLTDGNNYCIRKISTAGIITTFAGDGTSGFSGDGGPATAAQMNPGGIDRDAAGNLYVADGNNVRIRKISAAGIISTIAGTGVSGFSGDGGPATLANISLPTDLTATGTGEVVFCDYYNNRIRKISSSGIITTIAGTGVAGYSGDGGPATNAQIQSIDGLTSDAAGNVYFSQDNVVRMISTAGVITRVAGIPTLSGTTGDGGPATAAKFMRNEGLAHMSGNLYVADYNGYNIRKINSLGIISTVAGNSFRYYTGEGGPTQNADLSCVSITTDPMGNVYFFDDTAIVIWKVDASTGVMSRHAGSGYDGYYGDGGPATNAQLGYRSHFCGDRYGNIYLADYDYNVVRKVNTVGIISTVAGTGVPGFAGDGGAATAAQLHWPTDVAADTAGNLFIADFFNKRIRKVNAAGIISTVAGNGSSTYSGDGGLASAAGFGGMFAVAADKKGNVYASDDARIRKINATGVISTIAGNGTWGYSGDGGPATAALIADVVDLQVDDTGSIFFSQIYNYAIRKIDTFGIMSTYVGTGVAGFSGDGGPANLAKINGARGIHVDQSRNMYISDAFNKKIRFVCSADTISSGINISATATTICAGSSITFTAAAINAGSSPGYQWNRNGTNIAGATGSSYTTTSLSNGDIITCVLTPNNFAPCAVNNIVTSSGITIAVNPVSPTPSSVEVTASPAVVSFPGETLTYSASFINGGSSPTFQWFKNGTLVPGATANPWITSSVSNGDQVSVTVKTTDPCANPDSATAWVVTGVSNPSTVKPNINLYPNPNSGKFAVNGLLNTDSDEIVVEIANALGSTVFEQTIRPLHKLFAFDVNIANVATPGVYVLRIKNTENVFSYRFAVVREQ